MPPTWPTVNTVFGVSRTSRVAIIRQAKNTLPVSAISAGTLKLAVEGPSDFQGAYIKVIMQRRGVIIGSTDLDGFSQVEAEVPMAETFGFATDLRSCSQGKAEFTLEFAKYAPVPGEIQKTLIEEYQASSASKRR